ncbi:MAG: DUF86 domain-containing protein [Planctomycetes bacterium]|nr:DUF86 domain-containing protein [Planctomycetota bacterium]
MQTKTPKLLHDIRDAFRNLLIHGYDAIDDAQVWQVIAADLPILIAEIQALQADDGGHA